MLNDYFNQTAEFQKKAGTNQRGVTLFEKAILIECRLEQKHNLIKKSDGETVETDYICYLDTEISTGDKLNGLTVVSVSNMVNLDGEIIGYKAVM